MKRMEKRIYHYTRMAAAEYRGEKDGAVREYFQESIETWDADHDPHGVHQVRIIRQLCRIISRPSHDWNHNRLESGEQGGDIWSVEIVSKGYESLPPFRWRMESSTKRKFESGLRRAQKFFNKALEP